MFRAPAHRCVVKHAVHQHGFHVVVHTPLCGENTAKACAQFREVGTGERLGCAPVLRATRHDQGIDSLVDGGFGVHAE